MFFALIQITNRIESTFIVQNLLCALVVGGLNKEPCYAYSRRELVHELCAIPIFQFYSVAGIHTTCCTAGITHGSRYARIGNDRCNLTYISRLLIGRVGEITDCILLGTCTAEHNQSDFCWFLNIDFYIYILIYIFRIIIFHRCTSTRLNKNFTDIIHELPIYFRRSRRKISRTSYLIPFT